MSQVTTRLHIGCGDKPLDGYVGIDRKLGSEAYPLACDDGSVSEIYASHVLEHISHREIEKALDNWIAKLAPGGRLRIAVPDFQQIAKRYLAGEPIDVQQYTMGSQLGDNDQHRCVFDDELLIELLIARRMEKIGRFTPFVQDCSALDISLNIEAFKPMGPQDICKNTVAVLSAPRFGPTLHNRCAMMAFYRTNVPYVPVMGAYWHQVLCETIEEAIKIDNPYIDCTADYLITCDYDTIFTAENVLELYRLMEARKDVDAICAVQSMRLGSKSLFSIKDENGNSKRFEYSAHFDTHLKRIQSAHFGLTIFRAETLRAFPRPWMVPQPNKDGRWGDGRVDADIDFWRRWAENGRTVYLANRVVVGHMEEFIAWPGQDFAPVRQTFVDFLKDGMPPDARKVIP